MEKNKKLYVFIAIVAVVSMLVGALIGAGIAVLANKDKTPATSNPVDIVTEQSTTDNVLTPTLPVEDPSAPAVENPSVADPSGVDPTDAPEVNPSENATESTAGIKVGPYTTGDFYFYNAEGKNLKLRASASVDVDTGVEIPSGTKLVVSQIVASDVAAYPYWGAVTYKGTDGYVAMQFLMTAEDYIEEFGEQSVVATPGEYTAGTYVVSGTGTYGLKVKPEPGYGDSLTMFYDSHEVEVLAIEIWEDADDEELRYWGQVEWEGYDAYVCMAYLEKVD